MRLVFGTVTAQQDEKQVTYAVAKKFPYLKVDWGGSEISPVLGLCG
jgi:hypothetical protein